MTFINETDPEARRAFRRWLLVRTGIYTVLVIFAAIYLFPALIVISNVFRTGQDVAQHGIIAFPERFTLEPFVRAWTRTCVAGRCTGIAPNFFNSLLIAIPATIIATVLGALNGYILSKWRFPGADAVFLLIMLGVFIPGQIALLPWAWMMGRFGLYGSPIGLLIIHVVHGISFTTLFCRNFYATLPTELINAARIDGAGFWRIFRRVVLPLSPPILIVAAMWQFNMVWNDYLFGAVFSSGARQPITAALMSAGTGGSSAAVLIGALPPLLLFLFGGRYFVRGLTLGALK